MKEISKEQAALIPRKCYLKLKPIYSQLTNVMEKSADFLINNPQLIASKTITELSSLSDCSESTWFRLCKLLGYSGYAQMKEDFLRHTAISSNAAPAAAAILYNEVSSKHSSKEVAQAVFQNSVSALQDTLNSIDTDAYEKAIRYLCDANKIVLCGAGDSNAVVMFAYQKLFRCGLNVVTHTDQDLQLIALSQLKKGDVLLAISHSGRTKNILELSRYAAGRGIKVISLTNFPMSPIAKSSHVALFTSVFTQHPKGEIASKRIVQMCLIESIYINLLLRCKKPVEENIQSTYQALELNKVEL